MRLPSSNEIDSVLKVIASARKYRQIVIPAEGERRAGIHVLALYHELMTA
jgi:hypothetical protein